MLYGLPRKASPFDRASFIRHLALCAAALVAYAAREELQVGNSVLWVFGFAVLLNVLTVLFADRTRVAPLIRLLSPFLGIAGWSSLMFLTGGVRSPFVAGLSLEIILAALSTSLAGVCLTTAGALAGLCLQQIALGMPGSRLALSLEIGFLLVLGSLTIWVVRRWKHSEKSLARCLAEQRQRLEELEKELLEVQPLGRIGERVALLAHGLKNATHSLQGFARLIEPRLAQTPHGPELLEGLRLATGRLEELVHSTLGPPAPGGPPGVPPPAAGTAPLIRQVVREVATSYPAIRWVLALDDLLPSPGASPAVVREIVEIVVRNAAEAMEGHGEIAVRAHSSGAGLQIRVGDQGPGLPAPSKAPPFKPGQTTKPGGHGIGLYLAHRLLARHGGALRLAAADGGGTLCSIELPFHDPSSPTP